jgi:epoxyqueuosine reductase
MNSRNKSDVTSHIVEKPKVLGASLAGISSIDSLKDSASYKLYGDAEWPHHEKTVLVLALVHEETEPELDWWDDIKGGSPGNRRLIQIGESVAEWMKEEFNIIARTIPYSVEKGGIFLKDAAALAGVGIIGAGNLLVTPEFGPRIRLRALFLDSDLAPTGPLDFSPCNECAMPCKEACPQKAFVEGPYGRDTCQIQMDRDVANKLMLENEPQKDSPSICIQYCRACELACPIGR